MAENLLKDIAKEITISELKTLPAGQKLEQVMGTITTLKNSAYALAENGDSARMNILRIGSVFQIFLIDQLASGKRLKELTKEDWSKIASQVRQYAILEDGQRYSDFVFSLYADYIDISVETIKPILKREKAASISAISAAIREYTQKLRTGNLTEPAYTEECLWLSLEAMMKLLSASLTIGLNRDYADLVQAASQLAFEYGRCVLYSREQELVNQYVENQYKLDDQLKAEYEAYLAEVQKQADQFQKLVDHAFSADLHETLIQSAELARAAGVKEEELLTSIDDVDDFFM